MKQKLFILVVSFSMGLILVYFPRNNVVVLDNGCTEEVKICDTLVKPMEKTNRGFPIIWTNYQYSDSLDSDSQDDPFFAGLVIDFLVPFVVAGPFLIMNRGKK